MSELDGEGSILVEALAGLLAQQASADHLLHGQSGTILGVAGLGVDGLHDGQADIQTNQVSQSQGAHLVVRTVHHSGVDVFLGSDAVLQNDDSLVDHGEQDAVDHEAGSLADLDGVLAQVLGAAIDSLEGLVVGTGAADDLDQLHSGSGVEEVHAQNLLRTLGSGSNGGDGDGRGVGSQDGLGLADLVQFLEDALTATRAAVEEGIIAGGGSAYIHASKKVAELVATLEGDEKTGANVILKALEAPLFHISANAGLEGSVIINKVRESEPGVGFDALNEKYVDMVGAGILDPVKVTRSALQNATSVASTLLTTESVVATIKEDAPAMPAGAPGMGGMM